MLLEKHLTLATRAHYGTSFSPEKRGQDYVKEYSEELEKDMQEVSTLAGEPEDYRQRYETLFTRWMSAKGNCISTMITGGSNFPVRRAEKANRSEHNRHTEFREFREKYFARLKKNIRREARANTDPVADMRAQLEKAERLQVLMVEANKIIRSKTTDAEKVDLLTELKIPQDAAMSLLRRDNVHGYGFPSYRLTNNNANIKRMRERLSDLEKKANAETKETEREDGIKVVENAEADRLQIFFPGKPDAAMITKLKGSGFKWAPSNGCWQRQLTNNARYALKYILPTA